MPPAQKADAEIIAAIRAYDREAHVLRLAYAEIPFADRHQSFRDLFPPPPARVLDIGAGIGVDALGFAEAGYRVTAAEPSEEMRRIAMTERDHPSITWSAASLPDLSGIDGAYDLLVLSAVIMHVPPHLLSDAISRISDLAAPEAKIFMSLRHGPVPEGRLMHPLSAGDIIQAAGDRRLKLLRQEPKPDRTGRPGVSWTMMSFQKSR